MDKYIVLNNFSNKMLQVGTEPCSSQQFFILFVFLNFIDEVRKKKKNIYINLKNIF